MRTFRRRPPLAEHRRALHREQALAQASEPDTLPQTTRPSAFRLEYALLAAVAALITAFAFIFFYFDISYTEITAYGYVGLFAISLISASSIVLPMPGAAAITGAGAVLHPILGIPVPLLVGLVAGPAEALGELTGYAAGYGGSPLFRERSFYPRVKSWMEKRGVMTMFLLSSFPNPLVDVAGVAAGAVRMRILHFFVGVLLGKMFKNVYLSAGGWAAGELLRHVFG